MLLQKMLTSQWNKLQTLVMWLLAETCPHLSDFSRILIVQKFSITDCISLLSSSDYCFVPDRQISQECTAIPECSSTQKTKHFSEAFIVFTPEFGLTKDNTNFTDRLSLLRSAYSGIPLCEERCDVWLECLKVDDENWKIQRYNDYD